MFREQQNAPKVVKHHFYAVKYNKQDTIFARINKVEESFITENVKVEVFQGYSKAYNIGLYFRIKNKSSWAKSEKVTGLFRTSDRELYFGDRKHEDERTLLIFKLSSDNSELIVYEFQKGFNPSRVEIERLIKTV